MIKPTFYNLSEEKRSRIINAVMNEFAHSGSEKISINRIIKEAGISRGSFYQYFDDKVDLVEILVKVFVNFADESFYGAVNGADGDIFYTYIKLLEFVAEREKDKKQKMVLKNLFQNLKANDDLISDYMINRFEGFEFFRFNINKIDRSNLKYKGDEDVKNLCHILTQLLKNAFFDIFVMNHPCESVIDSFRRKLDIIKCGAVVK